MFESHLNFRNIDISFSVEVSSFRIEISDLYQFVVAWVGTVWTVSDSRIHVIKLALSVLVSEENVFVVFDWPKDYMDASG